MLETSIRLRVGRRDLGFKPGILDVGHCFVVSLNRSSGRSLSEWLPKARILVTQSEGKFFS